MIPIALPSVEFVLIRLACLLATLVWIIWTIRLAFSPAARGRLRTWRGPVFVVLTALGLYSIWSVHALHHALSRYAAEQQAAYEPVLDRPRTLGRIDMPAGTRLGLAIADQPEAFESAAFPHPVSIGGVEALRAERYLEMQTDASYRTSGFTPLNLRLTGIGDSLQAGWICDARAPIVFDTQADGAIRGFHSCTAASGNQIEAQTLPQGAEIIVTTGRVFMDGRRGADRWLIHLPQDRGLRIQGREQIGGALLLDAQRKVIAQIPR